MPRPSFPNVNRIAYYQDKKALKEIQRGREAPELDPGPPAARELRAPVRHREFCQGYTLALAPGQLCERTGDEDSAKAYYRLALKHHRNDITKIQLYYDSLEQKTQDLYVPLKTYYDIVEYRKNIVTFHPPKGVYTSMGDGINSQGGRLWPGAELPKQACLFSPQKRKTPRHYQPWSTKTCTRRARKGDYWTDAEPLPKPINSPYNEGSACLSKDGTHHLLCPLRVPHLPRQLRLVSRPRFKDGQVERCPKAWAPT